jgi:uncharacterized glyoxalase superfamily protein PhnB
VFTGLAPVLLAPNVAEALNYYRDVLGFDVAPYELAPEDYGYVSRNETRIHIAHADQCRPNSDMVTDLFDVYIWVDDVDAVHSDLQKRGANIVHGPTDRPWGMREIRVRDLNGYVLGIGQPLGS